MTERPTPAQVRKARKAELVAWCEAFGLDAEGKVDELRERILTYLETPAEPGTAGGEAEAPEEEAKEAPEEPEPAEEAEPEKAEKKAKKGEAEVEAFTPKAKPKLDATTRELLRLRAQIASKRPTFRRQEWFRHPRLGESWRKPQGMQSKLRRHLGYRINVVSVGYRGPKGARGLHPSGFREVLVHTLRDLEAVNPDVEAVRIAGGVGARKRAVIEAAADEKGIRVLNRRDEE